MRGTDFPASKYPKMHAFVERVHARPAYQVALQKGGRWLAGCSGGSGGSQAHVCTSLWLASTCHWLSRETCNVLACFTLSLPCLTLGLRCRQV